MFVFPSILPVAIPEASIVATVSFDDFQVAFVVTSKEVSSEYLAIALNC